MRDRLFILIGNDFPERVEWLRVSTNSVSSIKDYADTTASVASQTPKSDVEPTNVPGSEAASDSQVLAGQSGIASLSDIVKASGPCQVIVFVPGVDVTLTSARVPSKQRQHIISAVPFALEDQLASDIDSLHFALGPRNDDGVVPVAVVARERMDVWLERLRADGVEPDIMLPDIFGLPLMSEGWSALQYQHQVWLRRGAYDGLVIDGGYPQQWLELMLAEENPEQPQTIQWFSIDTDEGLGAATLWSDRIVEERVVDKTPLQLLAQNFSINVSINLIQGEYSPREQFGRLLRPWRQAAVLLLVVVLLGFGSLVIDYFSLNATSTRLAGEINQVYLDTFPAAKKVVDAQVQMQQKLIELGAGDGAVGNGFLPLLGRIGETLAGVSSADLRHASYQGGRLSLSLRITNLQLLEQLKSDLVKNSGLVVEVQSAASRDDFVDARLLIEGAS